MLTFFIFIYRAPSQFKPNLAPGIFWSNPNPPIQVVSIIKTPRLAIESSWRTLHWILEARGRGNCKGRSHYNMALKAIDQSNRINYGRSHYNMAFYCQWPIKSFTEISVSLTFASNFFVNNSSRRSSRCPRTTSLDDRDYYTRGINRWKQFFMVTFDFLLIFYKQ